MAHGMALSSLGLLIFRGTAEVCVTVTAFGRVESVAGRSSDMIDDGRSGHGKRLPAKVQNVWVLAYAPDSETTEK
jgi:hypothetical protein